MAVKEQWERMTFIILPPEFQSAASEGRMTGVESAEGLPAVVRQAHHDTLLSFCHP